MDQGRVGDRAQRSRPAKPAASGFAANAGVRILTQCSGQSMFIAWLDRNAVNRLVALAFGQGTLQRALFGQQRRQFRLGTRDGDLGNIAGGGQFSALCLGGFLRMAVRLQLCL